MVEEKKKMLELTNQEAYWLYHFLYNMRFTLNDSVVPKSIVEKIEKKGCWEL